jgi:signal transducing adaptor molecule
MMNTLDAKRDNLADNDELSELYQRTLSMRPKIVRLIEKYSQKRGLNPFSCPVNRSLEI